MGHGHHPAGPQTFKVYGRIQQPLGDLAPTLAAASGRPSAFPRKADIVMSTANLEILKSRRFLPLFITQFLGRLNDNIFKNALVILVTFKIAMETGVNGQMMSTIAAGLFILPFFLFSATAGRFGRQDSKSRDSSSSSRRRRSPSCAGGDKLRSK